MWGVVGIKGGERWVRVNVGEQIDWYTPLTDRDEKKI